MESFTDDILDSSLIKNPPEDHDDLVARYDSELSKILDKHAPLKKRIVTIRPSTPWYSEEIKLEKRKRRKLERRWRASRSLCDREAYTRQSKVLKNLLSSPRRNYYSNLVAGNQSNIYEITFHSF